MIRSLLGVFAFLALGLTGCTNSETKAVASNPPPQAAAEENCDAAGGCCGEKAEGACAGEAGGCCGEEKKADG